MDLFLAFFLCDFGELFKFHIPYTLEKPKKIIIIIRILIWMKKLTKRIKPSLETKSTKPKVKKIIKKKKSTIEEYKLEKNAAALQLCEKPMKCILSSDWIKTSNEFLTLGTHRARERDTWGASEGIEIERSKSNWINKESIKWAPYRSMWPNCHGSKSCVFLPAKMTCSFSTSKTQKVLGPRSVRLHSKNQKNILLLCIFKRTTACPPLLKTLTLNTKFFFRNISK